MAIKYNPINGRWEVVPDDWEVAYNPVENDWEFAPKKSAPVFNEVSGNRFEMRSPKMLHAGYNPVNDSWHAGAKWQDEEFKPVFDPVENEWEFKP